MVRRFHCSFSVSVTLRRTQKEVICINIGQAGVQLANAAWELFCIEHGIKANGQLHENLNADDSHAFTTFFQEVPNGQFVPRVVSVDLEPTVIGWWLIAR